MINSPHVFEAAISSVTSQMQSVQLLSLMPGCTLYTCTQPGDGIKSRWFLRDSGPATGK